MARVLDQQLLSKLVDKTDRTAQSVRESISKRAARLMVDPRVAQILWAKELGIGATRSQQRLEPHLQEQLRASVGVQGGDNTVSNSKGRGVKKGRSGPARSDGVGAVIDQLIQDPELKSRCADLLRRPRHFDRVYREATTVLDHRLKKLGGVSRMLPEKLVGRVLSPDPANAILVVSNEKSEQEGFHSICKGLMLAFRNPTHHGLDDKLTREDALRFCGFVDAILGILGKARKVERA